MTNFHTHTVLCDGKLTAEQMVQAAIDRGFTALGFTGHSYLPFDKAWCMTPDATELYKETVLALQKKYAGVIDIFMGIEQDYCSDTPTDEYDYVIGSAHCIEIGGKYLSVDFRAEEQQRIVREYYGGDFLPFIERYYQTVSDVHKKTNADIIGHFDLVSKFNEGGVFFDESSARYKDAAIGALESILKELRLFEVNTGSMYKLGRTAQYPSDFLLKELFARGGEIMLSSDSHDAGSLGYKFPEMTELLKGIGFRWRKIYTKEGFVDVKL